MKKKERIVRAATPEGQMVGEGVVEAVEIQIRDRNPPETRRTLKRLMKMGETRENAIRFIAIVLAHEMFLIMRSKTSFDEDRYVGNLKALPKMPDEW